MHHRLKIVVAATLLLLIWPAAAGAIVEPETKVEFPDEITVEVAGQAQTLRATGVGLREKTFLKVDVYVIVSYLLAGAVPGDDPGAAVRNLDVPKRIQMSLLRSFSREKLVNSFTEVIEKNYDDTSAFAADLAVFLAYFQRDAEEKDELIFDYVPGQGLTTRLNGETKGVIDNFAFVQALWTVWFGAKPASDGLKRELLSCFPE